MQLLSKTEPDVNVVVGSPNEPYASMGASPSINQLTVDENQEAALPIAAKPPGLQ